MLPDVNKVVDLNKFFIIIVLEDVKNFTPLFTLTLIPFKNADITDCYDKSTAIILAG